jgi:hypothetical protein
MNLIRQEDSKIVRDYLNNEYGLEIENKNLWFLQH